MPGNVCDQKGPQGGLSPSPGPASLTDIGMEPVWTAGQGKRARGAVTVFRRVLVNGIYEMTHH